MLDAGARVASSVPSARAKQTPPPRSPFVRLFLCGVPLSGLFKFKCVHTVHTPFG